MEGRRGKGRRRREGTGAADGEGRGAREDRAGSEEAMDADGQAIKGLWCWLDDRFGAVSAPWPTRAIPWRITCNQGSVRRGKKASGMRWAAGLTRIE